MDQDRLYVIKFYYPLTKRWELSYDDRFTLSEIVDRLKENLQNDEANKRFRRFMIEVVRE